MTQKAGPPVRLWCRPVVGSALLMGAFLLLSLLMSPEGYLGTDTGAKVATLDVMEQRDTARPVLGYWAEDLDPEGRLHPIFGSSSVDGDWVHVTTLPMLELARPLWALGGYRLTLLLPMAGAVGAAFAARAVAHRAAGEVAGWQAYWLVGLGSPITVYALDFWEHAPGVGLIVGAIALLAGVVDGSPVAVRALGAGALLGVAATMRTETFVYALVAVGGCGLFLLFQRQGIMRAFTMGSLALAAFAVPWAANAALEGSLGGNSRGGRASGVAHSALGRLGDRLEEAVVTLLAPRSGSVGAVAFVGGILALVCVAAIVKDRRGDEGSARLLLVTLGLVNVLVAARELGFVPGLFAAAPVALAALVCLPKSRGARYALVVALVALPMVWATQFVGGAGPQWAGRYTLASCTVLVALGVAALQRASRGLRLGLIGLTALVTVTGVLWLSERSNEVDRTFDVLVERSEDVVVVQNGFFIREGGAAYSERRWLTAVSDVDLSFAVEVIERSGLDTFVVLAESPSAPDRLAGARLVETNVLTIFGDPQYLHSYTL